MLLPVITPDTALSSLQSLNISVALLPLLILDHTLAGTLLILVLANILSIKPFPRVRPPTDVSSVQFSNILVLLPVSCPKSSAMLTKDLQSQNILDVSILEDICQSLGTVVIPVFSKALMVLERLGQPSNSPSGIDVILPLPMNVTYANLFAYLKILGGNSVKDVPAAVKAAPSSKSSVQSAEPPLP